MEKLRPVEDVWDELSEVDTTDEVALGIIRADRKATIEVSIGRLYDIQIFDRVDGHDLIRVCDALSALRHVAKSPETDWEQLARKLWEADMVQNIGHTPERHTPWEKIGDDKRIEWRNIAAVAITELDKIREEQKL